ncbi:MAG: putative DNA-binding domain-containing protein [Ignavibacteriales bacterium]|nr:putative DNA-binding domain-containing protein [Ignavibacteriales bacterium]
MQLSIYTSTQQNNFANFCKTTELKQIDGLTENRIDHYRRLIYGVIDDSLRSAYPLTENLLEEDEWQYLVDNFIEKHNCQSPQIWQMPFEFYSFIEENNFDIKLKHPFLMDLLLLEWKEIEIYMMQDLNDDEKTFESKFNDHSLITLNKEFGILKLDFPVHTKPANEIMKEDKREYFVLIFRANDKVQFYDLSPFFVFLIKKINEGNNLIENIVMDSIQSFKTFPEELVRENIYQFIKSMQSKGFILGYTNGDEKC